MPVLRIATRQSELALAQANLAATLLAAAWEGLEIVLVPLVTDGDRHQGSLQEAGGKELFVNTLRKAMAANKADCACHSLKDVGREPPGLVLASHLERADHRDALLGKTQAMLAQQSHPVVGSSSPRRVAQLASVLPHAKTRPVRGNINTRLTKLARGDIDALVLACAGLDRLGLQEHIAERLDCEHFVPAAGQGTIVLECHQDDLATRSLLERVDHPASNKLATAERACAHALGASCHTPLGVLATLVSPREVKLRCQLAHAGGMAVAIASGTDPAQVGERAAKQIIASGDPRVLEQIHHE